jgi:hypothetical protein
MSFVQGIGSGLVGGRVLQESNVELVRIAGTRWAIEEALQPRDDRVRPGSAGVSGLGTSFILGPPAADKGAQQPRRAGWAPARRGEPGTVRRIM